MRIYDLSEKIDKENAYVSFTMHTITEVLSTFINFSSALNVYRVSTSS